MSFRSLPDPRTPAALECQIFALRHARLNIVVVGLYHHRHAHHTNLPQSSQRMRNSSITALDVALDPIAFCPSSRRTSYSVGNRAPDRAEEETDEEHEEACLVGSLPSSRGVRFLPLLLRSAFTDRFRRLRGVRCVLIFVVAAWMVGRWRRGRERGGAFFAGGVISGHFFLGLWRLRCLSEEGEARIV